MNIEINSRMIFFDNAHVCIPAWVKDLASFRQWFNSGDFPEMGRICFLAGELWIDMSKEQFYSHNQVKTEVNSVFAALAKRERIGRYAHDGMRIVNVEADLSCQPDGSFVSHESLRTGRVRLIEGLSEGFLELEGPLDMVFEVVSPSSVRKDTEKMRELYWRAGIREYWLIDARGDETSFQILRHTAKKYVTVRSQKGWLKSSVFGKSFRLVRVTDEDGKPDFTLDVR